MSSHRLREFISLQLGRGRRAAVLYDELLSLQLALLARRNLELAGHRPFEHVIDGPKVKALVEALPFALTDESRTTLLKNSF